MEIMKSTYTKPQEIANLVVKTATELDKKRGHHSYKINYRGFNKFLRTIDTIAEGLKVRFHKNPELWGVEDALSEVVVKLFNLEESRKVTSKDIGAGLELLSEELSRYTMIKGKKIRETIEHLGIIYYCMTPEKDREPY